MNRRMLLQTAIAVTIVLRSWRNAGRSAAAINRPDKTGRTGRSGRHPLFHPEPDHHGERGDPGARVDVTRRGRPIRRRADGDRQRDVFQRAERCLRGRRGDGHADLEVCARTRSADASRRARRLPAPPPARLRRDLRRPPAADAAGADVDAEPRPTPPAPRCAAGLLAGHRGVRPAHLLDDDAGPGGDRREDREARHHVRRQRRAARHRADLAAGDLQEHPDHAGRSRAGKRADGERVRCRQRQAGVDLLSEGAARRSESLDVARRQRRVGGDARHLGSLLD